MTCLVFVYGTLKRGCPNSHLLPHGEATAIGSARLVPTTSSLRLVCPPPYYVPFLLSYPPNIDPPSHPPVSIDGEIFAVSPSILEKLDELEGTSRGYYHRVRVSTVGTLQGHTGDDPWLYLRRVPEAEVPHWSSVESVSGYSADLAGRYVRPDDRDPRWRTDLFSILNKQMP